MAKFQTPCEISITWPDVLYLLRAPAITECLSRVKWLQTLKQCAAERIVLSSRMVPPQKGNPESPFLIETCHGMGKGASCPPTIGEVGTSCFAVVIIHVGIVAVGYFN